MKIMLIRYHDLDNTNTRLAQSLNKRQGVLPPLGIAYVAATLERAGHSVSIIDAIALALSKHQVKERIREFNPKVVGITAMTPTVRGALEAARLVKEAGDIITVIGGVHMSIFAYETLTYEFVDFGIVGEGEDSMVEFCNATENGESYEHIDGLCYKKGGEIHVGYPRIVSDVNTLPMPSYHLLPMDKYSSIIGLHPTSTMMGSRGCPYKCGFCFKTPSDKRYRVRDVESIVDEIEHLIKNYGLKEIMFYDDLMPQDYARKFSNEVLRRNVKIKWQTPQRVNLVDKELLELMARAGCHILRFGVEQGDEEMMRFVEKKISLPLVKKAFQDARNAGIDTFAYFIIGYIYETEETMQKTIDLAIELNPRYVMFTKAVPLPETPLMHQSVKESLVSADYWRRYVMGEDLNPIQTLVSDADKWVKKAYRSFYLRPSKIFDQMLRIGSFSDLVKNISGFIGVVGFAMRDDAFSVLKKSSNSNGKSTFLKNSIHG
jgi:radical SAM superfamily enzyme YgiQ (UPF0313 family)